jgi:hypothetical protein
MTHVKTMNRVTVRTVVHVRRTFRKTNVARIAVKTAIYSVVPSALDDVVIHHAHMSLSEVQNIATDTIVISAMSMALKALVKF